MPGSRGILVGLAWPRNGALSHTSRRRGRLQLRQLGELFQGHGSRGLGGLHVRLHLVQVPLQLSPAVLEPRDDLCVGQTQVLGDLVPVRRAQVLLVQKMFLQLIYLVVGEGRAGLPPLLGGVPVAEQRQAVSACGRGKKRTTEIKTAVKPSGASVPQ